MPVIVPEEPIRAALGAVDELESLDGGSQGHVWRVRQDGNDTVLKVIPDGDPVRVQREIEGLKSVASPFVMSFTDVLVIEHAGARWPAIRGEFVPGGTIADKLATGQLPTAKEAVACCVGSLRGIQAIQAQGLVHRDIKPQNVALRGGDWIAPVVLDLGLARDLEASITRYPELMGTLPFMAPEQLRLERAVKRTDVFAVGALLFVLLTGELPYLDASDPAGSADEQRRLMLERTEQPGWPRWSRVQQQVDQELAAILSCLLATEAYERPTVASSIELLEQLAVAQGS